MFTRKTRTLGLMTVAPLLPLLVSVVSLPLSPAGLGAAEPTKDAKSADEVTALRKARVVLAQKGYDAAVPSLRRTRRFGNVLVQEGKPEEIYGWSVRWLRAERALSPKKVDQIAALEAHLKRMTKLEKEVGELSKALLSKQAELDAEWYRLEAQLWLAEAKAK